MRINIGYTLHQSLTTETAAIVKQAITFARRRGHAQVTPLHVAIAMLSSPTSGLLKRACLQSHSHPLQSKALDFCFNVALNRLPTSSTPLMIIGPRNNNSHQLPSLSNALIAAFKRAQAHQRRGSVEHGPMLALKVEIHQLVISILYDPSVSRVMREAGFSSAQVRSIVEQSDKSNVSINSNNTVNREMQTTQNLSQFRLNPYSSLCRNMNQPEEHNTNLALSLRLENSDMHGEGADNCKSLLYHQKADEIKNQHMMNCCCCSENLFKKAAVDRTNNVMKSSTSKLPAWLQQYKDENTNYHELQYVSRKPELVSNPSSRKPELVSNPSSSPNSASSSEDNTNYMEFKELISYNCSNIIGNAPEKEDDDREEGDSDEMMKDSKCDGLLLDLNMATEVGNGDDDVSSVSKEIGVFGFSSKSRSS